MKLGTHKNLVIISAVILISFVSVVYFQASKKNQCCNIIVISVTNLAANHMSLYGYSRDTTPNIDSFAKQAIVFDNAFTHASWTLPSGASMFTSLYPTKHNLTDRYSGEFLPNKITTLTDILNKNGYATAAFTGGFDYSLRYNVVNRFSETEVEPTSDTQVFGYGSLNQTSKLAFDWLEKNSDKRYFLFVQGYDVHCPFTPSERYDKLYDPDYNGNMSTGSCYMTFEDVQPVYKDNKTFFNVRGIYLDRVEDVVLSEEDVSHLVALYDGEIKQMDAVIGNFLNEIKKMRYDENTIIIITSEHGDMLGKHGRFMRGGPIRGTFYDDVIHAPLIIRHPDFQHKTITGLVQFIDIAPTILDFLGLTKPDQFEGKSMMPLIVGNETVNGLVFAGSSFIPPEGSTFFNKSTTVVVARNFEWKLIKEITKDHSTQKVENISYELYNLKSDPEELNNVFGSNKGVALSLEATIKGLFGI